MSNNISPDADDSLYALTADSGGSDHVGSADGGKDAATPHADTGRSGSNHQDKDVARAVEFLKLLGASSLGTPEAREERLAGREELEKLEQAGSAPPLTENERDFDLQVASELEWRGYPFEAELRYRVALQPGRPAKPLTLLALLLEAKGRPGHALPLYVCAAQAREPNALFRLATISHQLGKPEWSRDFVELGSASLEPEQVKTVATTLDRLRHDQAALDLGAVLSRSVLQASSNDAAYALGSVLLTAGHTYLARLTFCTALAKGHTLAALSLLDQRSVRRTSAMQHAHKLLGEAWDTGFGPDANALRRDRPGLARIGDMGSTLAGATDSTPDRLSDSNGGTVQSPGSVQRILVFARVVTTLRGLMHVGYDPASLRLIDKANKQLCTTIRSDLDHGRLADEAAVITRVWSAGADPLARAKQRRRQLPAPAVLAPAERVPAAGVTQRYGHAFAALRRDQRQALILDLSGASRAEIGSAMNLETERDVNSLVHAAVKRLQAEQQGEQFDPQLWAEVEQSLAVVAPELKADFARRPEPETGRSTTDTTQG